MQLQIQAKSQPKCRGFSITALNLITTRALSMPNLKRRSTSRSSQIWDLNSTLPWCVSPVKRWPKICTRPSNYRLLRASSKSQLEATLKRLQSEFLAKATTPCLDSQMCATTRSALLISGRDSSSQKWTKNCFCHWVKLKLHSITQTRPMVAQMSSSRTWIISLGTLVNCQSRMALSLAWSLFHSRMLEEFKLTGTSRCPTTLKSKWKPGLTLELPVLSKLLRKKF